MLSMSVMIKMYLCPLLDVTGYLPVMSIESSFLASKISVLKRCMLLLRLDFGLVEAVCCLCNFMCPFDVSILLVQNCLTLLVVRPGKLVNHPLFVALSQVVIGGAPMVMWWKLMRLGMVLTVTPFALWNGCRYFGG